MIDKERLLERFLRYVRIDTTAREGQSTYPSSPGQLELGRLLRDELLAIGLADAVQTDKGIVLATVPATVERPVPVVALNCPRRHFARDDRRGRPPASDPRLCRRRHRLAGQSAGRDSHGRRSRARRAGRLAR